MPVKCPIAVLPLLITLIALIKNVSFLYKYCRNLCLTYRNVELFPVSLWLFHLFFKLLPE